MNKDKIQAYNICVMVLNDKLTLEQKFIYYRKATIQLLKPQRSITSLEDSRSLIISHRKTRL